MEVKNFFAIIKNRGKIVFLIVLFFVVLATIVSLSQALKYRSSSRLLIIQDNPSLDSYNLAKSNQYLGSLLTEAAYSGSFFELLSSSDSRIDWSYFGSNYKDQVKKWKETISVQNVGDTGIIQIDIYYPDQTQAKNISLAVNNLLIAKNGLYQNSGDNLKIKIIDQPILSSWPVKPNLLLNFITALILGTLFSFSYVYYFPAKKVKKESVARIKENVSTVKEGASTTKEGTKVSIPVYTRPDYSHLTAARQEIPVSGQDDYHEDYQRHNNSGTHFSGNMRNIVG